MLALDYSLGRIDTSECDVLDLFESPPVPITLTGSRPEPRTAYVCAVKKKANVQVYVALAGEHGRNFVYTEPDSSEGGKNYHDALEQALGFARSMGFAPERVNLDYTPAMRAVVVRNFKIFNFPGSGTRKAANTPTLAYQRPALPQAESLTDSPAIVAPVAMAASVASVASAAKTSSRLTTSGTRTASQFVNVTDRDEQTAVAEVIVKFGQEMSALRAERDALAARVQELAADQLGISAELKTAKAENDMLRAERDELAETVATLDTMSSGLAAMQEKMSQLTLERDEIQRKHEQLLAEHEALAESAAKAKEELAKAQEQAAGSAKEAAKTQAAAARAIEVASTAQAEASRAQAEAAEARKEIAKAQEEVARERGKATRAQEEADKAQEAAARAVREAASAYEEATRAQEQIGAAQAEAERAQEKAATALAEAAEAREEIARAQEEATREKEAAAKAKMEAARLRKEREVAATLTEELAQGKTTAVEEIEALVERINALSAERDAAISGSEELHRQLNAKGAELEATSTKLTAIVEEREKLLTLGREQASLVAALEKRLATAPAEVPQAVTDSLPVAAPAELESRGSDQQERYTPQATSLPVLEAPSKENTETAADPVAEQAFNFFEAETATFAPLSFGSAEAAEAAVMPVVQPGFGSFEAETRIYPDFAYEHADTAEAETYNLAPAAPSVPFVGFESVEDSFFGGFSDASETSTVFEPRFELTALEISHPDEVVELHKSSNVASVAPEGNRQERCEGYICCLRSKSGLEVFAVIHGTQSGKIGIYAAVPQPSDQRGVAAAVAGAIVFHEQIGFMMEPLDLGTSEQRSKAIADCPVLRRR